MPMVEIQAKDGGTFSAYIAVPDVTPAPAVIVIQEIFGINKEMREKCDQLADRGYLAIAPDLFWRIEPGIELYDSNPAELQRAFHLFSVFDVEKGIQDLISTLDLVRGHEDCTGKVGCVGYCLGGKLAYMLAAASDIDAAVSYYGVGIEGLLGSADKIKQPILFHIAGADEYVPPAAQEKIIERMKDHDTAETYRYAGMEHAFARTGGMHYNADAAELANGRTYDFLKANLAKGGRKAAAG